MSAVVIIESDPGSPRRAGSVTRLPSGSLRVKVYAGLDPVTGRQRYIGETVADGPLAREQAEEACRRLLGQVRRRRSLHSHARVNDLLNRHLAMAHVGEHSRRSYLLMAAKHLRPFIGDLPLRAVTPEKVEHLYAELLRCRNHCPPRAEPGHRCRPLHANTVRKPPSVAEAVRILGEAWKDSDLGPLVWLAMATGARRGELCALRWQHVDPDQGVLVVRASIAQLDGEVWEKDTKLHQRRHIALDRTTIAVLNVYHEERRQRAAAVGTPLPADGFVFSPRIDGRTPRSPNAVTCQYRRMVDRLGIRTTFHKLRHYSATELIRAGVDIRTVAGRLGHAEGGTTLTYYAAWVREADHGFVT